MGVSTTLQGSDEEAAADGVQAVPGLRAAAAGVRVAARQRPEEAPLQEHAALPAVHHGKVGREKKR